MPVQLISASSEETEWKLPVRLRQAPGAFWVNSSVNKRHFCVKRDRGRHRTLKKREEERRRMFSRMLNCVCCAEKIIFLKLVAAYLEILTLEKVFGPQDVVLGKM